MTIADRPEQQVLDDIDALVDWQLQQESSGYDHNINQQLCRICGEDTHTLPITEGLRRQRTLFQRAQIGDCCDCYMCQAGLSGVGILTDAERAEMDSYRYADDKTSIVCPGSDFIGPWASEYQLAWMRTRVRMAPSCAAVEYRSGNWLWVLPDNPFADAEPESAPPPEDVRQRALRRPSTTPPMWAVDATRTRRRRNG